MASAPAISAAELVELTGGTGRFLYYPLVITIDPGDVFYLRERNQGENGIIVQVIKKEILKKSAIGNQESLKSIQTTHRSIQRSSLKKPICTWMNRTLMN
jgi:hypothetical protein